MKISLSSTLLFCILTIFSSAASADKPEYYAVMMDGQKVGHAIMTREIKDGKVYTGQQMSMTISRMGVVMTAESSDSYIETIDAEPLGFESKMSVSGMESGSKGKILENGKMEVYVYAGGMGQTQIMDYPPDALMAEGVLKMQKKRGLNEGDKFTVKCFIPSMLAVGTVEAETFGKEKVKLFGTVATATKQKITTNINGQIIATIDYVGNDMKIYKSIMPSMGMNFELISCDKKFALSDNVIVDMLDETLVQCPAALPDRSTLKSVTYYLEPNDDVELAIPSEGSQSVSQEGKLTLVKVTQTKPDSPIALSYSGANKEILDATKPTQYIQSSDQSIIALAKQAIGNTQDAATAVYEIEKFVGDYITNKNMSVGYASAVEVANTKEGDCTEHAVLTAALCRAIGIPARIAVGLVYVDSLSEKKNVFGGHAWTEAYIGDKWIGLDATRGYGPGHIKLASGNGDPGDFLAMMNLMGSFEIKKVDIEK